MDEKGNVTYAGVWGVAERQCICAMSMLHLQAATLL